ncbi:CBS domain-containing protein [Vibrio porteresiae]|uniref:CBS domain-containing protein n=1 Tax=Vibrio porteresiae DSM 19223 TaxID=1123496 RepID=A0ABZ0QBC1_9VIBR|nr:CBS domain-containing protein [Vibrio porteresiae]WPC73266.1 CBS domain-containing protein [Vibrio porteresiae DSM 19223]
MDSIQVKDYMTYQPVTFTPDMPLTAALTKLLKANRPGGPVIDNQEHVIGFISEQDLLDKLMKASYYCQDSHVVGDCMHREVLTVSPDMSIIELADLMQVGKPKVYPVVDNQKLVGLISRTEVLKAVEKNLVSCFKHPV